MNPHHFVLEIQRELALALASSTELAVALEICHAVCRKLTGMDCGGVYLLDESTGDMDLAYHKALSRDFQKNCSHFKAASLPVWLLMKGKAFYFQNHISQVFGEWLKNEKNINHAIILPIRYRNKIFGGILLLSSFVFEIRPSVRIVLETISYQIGDVIYRFKMEKALSRAYEELEKRVDQRTEELIHTNVQLELEIQERRLVEAALRLSEEKFRTFMETANDLMFIMDNGGRFTYVNASMIRTLNYKLDDLIGLSYDRVICRENLPFYQFFLEKLADEEAMTIETVWLTQDRKRIRGEVKIVAFYDENGQLAGCRGVFRDLSEHQRLQDQLIQSERLAAIGQLAVSVAHEINSPLQAITTMLTNIKENHPQTSEEIDLIKEAFFRIRDIVRNLNDLNRPGKSNKLPINLNEVILKTVSLLQGVLKNNNIHIQLDLSSELRTITASQQQFSQVLLNLINNSVEAFSGIIKRQDSEASIQTGDNEIQIHTRQQNEEVLLFVMDNGPGISEEDFQYLFDPFYTRKKPLGMGVGLTICHNIITDHEGTIEATKREGGGAVFKIRIPVK